MNVPFVDLHAQYLGLKDEVDAVIGDVIKNSLFVRGPYVEKFEQMFAEVMGQKYCVSCANGTDSLYIAMVALGICLKPKSSECLLAIRPHPTKAKLSIIKFSHY